jgi:hypothetical protein
MVGNSNIVLLVATGENPDYPSNQVIIWDDKQMVDINKVQFDVSVKSLSFS